MQVGLGDTVLRILTINFGFTIRRGWVILFAAIAAWVILGLLGYGIYRLLT